MFNLLWRRKRSWLLRSPGFTSCGNVFLDKGELKLKPWVGCLWLDRAGGIHQICYPLGYLTASCIDFEWACHWPVLVESTAICALLPLSSCNLVPADVGGVHRVGFIVVPWCQRLNRRHRFHFVVVIVIIIVIVFVVVIVIVVIDVIDVSAPVVKVIDSLHQKGPQGRKGLILSRITTRLRCIFAHPQSHEKISRTDPNGNPSINH